MRQPRFKLCASFEDPRGKSIDCAQRRRRSDCELQHAGHLNNGHGSVRELSARNAQTLPQSNVGRNSPENSPNVTNLGEMGLDSVGRSTSTFKASDVEYAPANVQKSLSTCRLRL